MIKRVPSLIIIDFRFNPIYNRKYYQKWMICHCHKLEYLDGLRINKKVIYIYIYIILHAIFFVIDYFILTIIIINII